VIQLALLRQPFLVRHSLEPQLMFDLFSGWLEAGGELPRTQLLHLDDSGVDA
jgi:hypothetical protein